MEIHLFVVVQVHALWFRFLCAGVGVFMVVQVSGGAGACVVLQVHDSVWVVVQVHVWCYK